MGSHFNTFRFSVILLALLNQNEMNQSDVEPRKASQVTMDFLRLLIGLKCGGGFAIQKRFRIRKIISNLAAIRQKLIYTAFELYISTIFTKCHRRLNHDENREVRKAINLWSRCSNRLLTSCVALNAFPEPTLRSYTQYTEQQGAFLIFHRQLFRGHFQRFLCC